jgi:hypothetical protein
MGAIRAAGREQGGDDKIRRVVGEGTLVECRFPLPS